MIQTWNWRLVIMAYSLSSLPQLMVTMFPQQWSSLCRSTHCMADVTQSLMRRGYSRHSSWDSYDLNNTVVNKTNIKRCTTISEYMLIPDLYAYQQCRKITHKVMFWKYTYECEWENGELYSNQGRNLSSHSFHFKESYHCSVCPWCQMQPFWFIV